MNQTVVLDIVISAADYQRFYRGQARMVQGRALDGRSVKFPASLLRTMVRHDGVCGRFLIEFDAQGKFQSIKRLSRVSP
jgi:hypothetical protein